MFATIRRLLIGKPLPTARQAHERLPKFLALPVFASDALSSVAYATEEILLALAVVIGAGAWGISQGIAVAIAVLLGIVALSYRQTIFAYPQGGGSYTVTKENLGVLPGLIAAGSLLTDYVLTVSVSIAAGVAAIVSANPELGTHKVTLGVMFVAIVALANLRGVRESGWLFAPPTYIFVFSLFTMMGVGLYKAITHAPINYITPISEPVHASGSLTVFLVLKAFAGGCAALTGTEAIANGIPAFRPPESKNAAITIVIMAFILGSLFMGTTYLAHLYRVLPVEGGHETVISQIARGVFGGRGWFYYLIQYATAAILILAANTAFQDFPRLSQILARDRFAPRQLANLGDKLVFSNGIVALAIIAALLIMIFHGETHALIPLYAVGVFVTFTLSQTGMVVRHRRLKAKGWRVHAVINSIGAFATGVVAIVIASVKFMHGAYIVIILIPLLVYIFHKIHQHYIELGNQLRIEDFVEPPPIRTTSIVLTAGIHEGILPALQYAKSLSHDCRALYIETNPDETPFIRDRWEDYGLGVPLIILESPYRSVNEPILKYIEEAKKERQGHIVTVVVPEFVPKKWWHKLLHNQSGLFLKIALMLKRDIVVTNVRYYLDK